MKVVVRAAAETDLDSIYAWIAKDNPHAAAQIVSRIRDRFSLLELDSLAHMGRPGLVAGTRELIEHPYIIVYKVDDERQEIIILAVLHGAHDRELQAKES